MKAINILWDVDDERDLEFLPTEIEIPESMCDEDDISDYLSDETGFCHKGFELVDECGVVMNDSEIIAQLELVLTELDARNISCNCPTTLRNLSWTELCNKGIELFTQLRHDERDSESEDRK